MDKETKRQKSELEYEVRYRTARAILVGSDEADRRLKKAKDALSLFMECIAEDPGRRTYSQRIDACIEVTNRINCLLLELREIEEYKQTAAKYEDLEALAIKARRRESALEKLRKEYNELAEGL